MNWKPTPITYLDKITDINGKITKSYQRQQIVFGLINHNTSGLKLKIRILYG